MNVHVDIPLTPNMHSHFLTQRHCLVGGMNPQTHRHSDTDIPYKGYAGAGEVALLCPGAHVCRAEWSVHLLCVCVGMSVCPTKPQRGRQVPAAGPTPSRSHADAETVAVITSDLNDSGP